MAIIYTKFTGGKRFDDHTIPDDLIDDVKIFVEIVQRHARHLYLANSQRKKLSKDIKDGFKLKVKVFPGSTAFAYDRVNEVAVPLVNEEIDTTDYLSMSAEDINSIMSRLSVGTAIIPEHLKDCFDKLGRNLTEEETFNIGKDEGFTNPTILNFAARQRMRVVSLPYFKACSVRGVVDKLGVFDNSIMLKSNLSPKPIHVQFAPYLFTKMRAIHGDTEHYSVKFFGLGRYDVRHQLLSITHGQHIIPFYNGVMEAYPSIDEAFTHISQLGPDWFEEGEGAPFNEAFVSFSRNLIQQLVFQKKIPAPYIFPLPDNQISAEWSIGEYELSITFDFENKSLVLLSVNTKRSSSEREVIDVVFENSIDIDAIYEFFKNFFPGVADE